MIAPADVGLLPGCVDPGPGIRGRNGRYGDPPLKESTMSTSMSTSPIGSVASSPEAIGMPSLCGAALVALAA